MTLPNPYTRDPSASNVNSAVLAIQIMNCSTTADKSQDKSYSIPVTVADLEVSINNAVKPGMRVRYLIKIDNSYFVTILTFKFINVVLLQKYMLVPIGVER